MKLKELLTESNTIDIDFDNISISKLIENIKTIANKKKMGGEGATLFDMFSTINDKKELLAVYNKAITLLKLTEANIKIFILYFQYDYSIENISNISKVTESGIRDRIRNHKNKLARSELFK